MRWALGPVLVALGCDAFGRGPPDVRSTPPGVGGTTQGPTNGAGLTPAGSPPSLIDNQPAVEPEYDPDWCTVAEQQGATFCEAHEDPAERVLEYCEPAAAAPPSEGGASGTAGGAGMEGGGAGAGGVAGQPAECVQYERPPEWVYGLLIQCAAHCGVGIRNSTRQLEGSCCYLARSEYYGR